MSEISKLTIRQEPSGYRPEPIDVVPPLFRWPIQPLAITKWLFGFPGYLWPWQALFIGAAFVLWEFSVPTLNQMQTLAIDWIAMLAAGHIVVLVVFVGAWHAVLYVMRVQGTEYKYNSKWPSTDDPSFLFRNQVWDNFFLNVCSAVPVWTVYETATFWLQASGRVPVGDWTAQPIYCIVLLLVTPIWVSIHFYAIHRLLHWPPLYRMAHRIHHKNSNPCPWSGLAMHPLEHLLYYSAIALYWIVPAHPFHALYLMVFLSLSPALGHHGFDRLTLGKKISFASGDYMHYLHHKYVNVNFGTLFIPFDKWFGTYFDGSEQDTEILKKLARERMRRSARRSQRGTERRQ